MKIKNKIWFVTKIMFLSISFLIYAFFIFRLCSTGSPEAMKHVVWDDTVTAAYRADPEAFEIWKQDPVAYITDDGRFWISDILYLPEAKQLQITVKYNNSTLKYLKEALVNAQVKAYTEENGAAEETLPVITLPDEPFDYTLLDDLGNRYPMTSTQSAKKQNYNYRRLVFDNIEMTETSSYYIDAYYVGAVDYTAAPYGSLLAWHNRMSHETVDIRDELPESMK